MFFLSARLYSREMFRKFSFKDCMHQNSTYKCSHWLRGFTTVIKGEFFTFILLCLSPGPDL